MKAITILLLTFIISINTNAQKTDYADVFKDIISSSAENFKGFVGEKILENEKGVFYKAPANQVDADTVYFANLNAFGTMGFFAVYRINNSARTTVQDQMNIFMNDYNNEGLANVQLSQNGNNVYLVMTNKQNGKMMATVAADNGRSILQISIFSGWYDGAK